jgi:hypothetical protein
LGANKASGKDDKNSGKEYHATVTPAENFDALKDADTLHDANGKISNATVIPQVLSFFVSK